MAANQVSMNGEELINLTADTVSEETLLEDETAHDASGNIITGKFVPYNPNLLINFDFSINQRGISGVFSAVGAYFVDMWKLVEGTVTVNTDGTITLNGTICQIRENSINGDFLAYASAGTASYDDSTKTFTLTASGETINWVMLVKGKLKAPFIKGNEALELVKCQWYFERLYIPLNKVLIAYTSYVSTSECMYVISYKKKRSNPTITSSSYGRFVDALNPRTVALTSFTPFLITPDSVTVTAVCAGDLGNTTVGWVDGLEYVDISAEL